MTTKVAWILWLPAALIAVALVTMLATGYVPGTLIGPMNERIFDLLFGVGTGLIIAVGLGMIFDD